MKKWFPILLSIVIFVQVPGGIPARAASAGSSPRTAYAKQFVEKCEGQAWFMEAIEKILNENQRTLDSIASSQDLDIVKSIGLKGHNVSGHIPAAVGELKELQYLFLSGNKLSGTIPEPLYTLPKLQNLDLSNNQYTGSIPSRLGSMKSLTHLNLRGNQYTGGIPTTILENGQLQFLDVSSNKLSGKLPENFTQMAGLQYLALSDNPWEAGPLPDLSSLSGLKVLSAWNCRFEGLLLDSLYSLTELQVLDLDSNALSGEIKEAIGDLANLQQISLANNRFRGILPQTMDSLAKLETLDISNNLLRGVLPESYSDITVYAQNNYMTGTVLKECPYNAGNFADGATNAQYQLTATQTGIKLSQTEAVDLYALLQNRALLGGGAKPILQPNEYEVEYDASKFEVIRDYLGIYVRALAEVPASEEEFIRIRIGDNSGSVCSTVDFHVATDLKPENTENTGSPSGGGSSGGSSGGGQGGTGVSHSLYINGFPDGAFQPEANVTREQVAKLLVDALGDKPHTTLGSTYIDVERGRWSAAWIETATQNGYMQGYGDGRFGPSAPITRAEMATALVRIAEKRGKAVNGMEKNFPDVKADKWYAQPIKKAVEYGLVSGYPDGTFGPEKNLTRAEAVSMINRMLGRDYKTAAELHGEKCPFPDVSKNYWAYGDIMEAALTHYH